MSTQNPERDAQSLSGSTPGTTINRLFLATRPKLFTASLLPVLAGFARLYPRTDAFDQVVSGLALLATALVHAASNVHSDVGDDVNPIYPFGGGSRLVPNGVMSRREMARVGERGVAVLCASMQIMAFAILAGLVVTGRFSAMLLIVPTGLLLLAFRATTSITPEPHHKLIDGINMTRAIQLPGGLWLVACLLLLA